MGHVPENLMDCGDVVLVLDSRVRTSVFQYEKKVPEVNTTKNPNAWVLSTRMHIGVSVF